MRSHKAAQGAWDRAAMVPTEEVLAAPAERYDLVPVGRRGSAPARECRIGGRTRWSG